MPDENDSELRSRFARLRDDERAAAGSYQALRARGSRPQNAVLRPYGLVVTLAAAALLVAAGLTLSDRLPPTREPGTLISGDAAEISPASIGLGSASRTPLQLAWRTPTDVLLDTPGGDLLRGIPTLGPTDLIPLAKDAGDLTSGRRSNNSTPSRTDTSRNKT